MQMSLESLIDSLTQTARDIWICGWSEAGAGNISIRVDKSIFQKGDARGTDRDWVDLDERIPELGGEDLLITASGSLFRVLGEDPIKGCGLIEIDGEGERYRIVWGFEPEGRPTSEMKPHVAAHRPLVMNGFQENKVLVHVHAPNLVAMTCALSLDTISLTRLLWGMHSECIALFPEGIEVAQWQLPGSSELSMVTAKGFTKRRVVVWPFHGVVAAGRDLAEAFGLIEVGEKAAELYLKTYSLGGAGRYIEMEDLKKIADGFGVEPDPEIMDAPMPDICPGKSRNKTWREVLS